MQVPAWFTVLSLALFGVVFGSFANVVIWRFPRGESLSVPGSHCPRCDTAIRWYDNLPVLSWLLLRGRCRACGEPIAWRYPAVELLSGVLWVLAWVAFGVSLKLPFAIALFYLLLILSFIDLDTMRLPNKLVALLAIIGVVGVAVSYVGSQTALPLLDGPAGPIGSPAVWALIGVVAGMGPALLMSVLYALTRGSQGLGMGDVKLLAVLGIFLGPYAGLVLFLGAVIGILAVALGRRVRGAHAKVPFGPSLALAGVLIAVWGPELVGWYIGML